MPKAPKTQQRVGPKVSIVMSVHEGEPFLEDAIESIQRQTYADFEFIVINDRSGARTESILARQIDARFVVIDNEKPIGRLKSFQIGMSRSRGIYIARMNANDLSHARRIQLQVDCLDGHPDIALVGSSYYIIDNYGMIINRVNRHVKLKASENGLQREALIAPGSVMFRRSFWQGSEQGDESRHYSTGKDSWRIAAKCRKVANIEQSLYYSRDPQNSIAERQRYEQTNCVDGAKNKNNENDETIIANTKSEGLLKKPTAPGSLIERNRKLLNAERMDYGKLHGTALSHPDDAKSIQAFFLGAVAAGKLVHAKSVLSELLQQHPLNHHIRKLLIAVFLKLNDIPAAMYAIESLVAFAEPDDALIDSALEVRKRMGPCVINNDMEGKPRISLCMIVKNEQTFLAPCLNSIKGIVDEIIVVDTGSSDRSADIAQIYGATIHKYEWCNDFSAARNLSLSKANGDWILILDADEIIASRDQASIIQLVNSDLEKNTAYAFKTRNYTNLTTAMAWQANDGCYPKHETGIGWFPTTKVRLFPNDVNIRFAYPVHELVDPSIRAAGLKIINYPVPIHHYGTVNEAKNKLKAKHYFELGYVKLEQFENNRAALRELAIQAGQLGRWIEAIDLWQRLLAIVPAYGEALANIAGAYWQLGNYKKGLTFSRQAVQIEPDLKEGQYNLAINMMMNCRLKEALDILQKIIQRHPNYLAAEFMLGVVASLNDEYEKGRAVLKSVERKISRQALHIAIEDLQKKMVGSGLDEYKHKINKAAA